MDLTRRGMRVLALGWKDLSTKNKLPVGNALSKIPRHEIESDLNFAGFVAFRCLVRKDSKEVLGQLQQGISPLLTYRFSVLLPMPVSALCSLVAVEMVSLMAITDPQPSLHPPGFVCLGDTDQLFFLIGSHKLIMITGDATLTASYVANEVDMVKAEKVIILQTTQELANDQKGKVQKDDEEQLYWVKATDGKSNIPKPHLGCPLHSRLLPSERDRPPWEHTQFLSSSLRSFLIFSIR